MEPFSFDKDVEVLAVEAESFPNDIQKAHESLHAMLPAITDRRTFGISWGSPTGEIRYLAAADIMDSSERTLPGTKTFTIKKGPYHSVLIHDFMNNISAIGQSFNQLLKTEKLDPQGYCLEWYLDDKDVRCMVLVRE